MAVSPIVSPIISTPYEPVFFPFSSEKAVGKRWERRGWIWPLCLENRVFPVYVSFSFLSFFCIFSVKKRVLGVLLYKGKGGEKKGKEGDYCLV